jgi:hypothetical protein
MNANHTLMENNRNGTKHVKLLGKKIPRELYHTFRH